VRLAIEGSNLRRGGGVTHLCELLRAADPRAFGITSVTVWAGKATLDQLPPSNDWLRLETGPHLDAALPRRLWWQTVELAAAARRTCDVLFVPGGSYAGAFRPFVTMSRSLLPFERGERARYGVSPMRLKLSILERAMCATLRRADGVIFLNDYAQRAIIERTGALSGRTTIVPHGVDEHFRVRPRTQRPIEDYDADRPFRLLYVSIIDVYKHQWVIAEAVARLRARGLPVVIDFVGPSYAPALRRFEETRARLDPAGKFLRLNGAVRHGELPRVYAAADAFVFASSCENMPNIVLEAMASGLPIASSNRGPMPEMLGDTGILFDPENVGEAEAALHRLVTDASGRERWAQSAYDAALAYSWTRCAAETYSFLAEIAK
jgi:glycosyltransferase involved in cell wall biosynthesis